MCRLAPRFAACYAHGTAPHGKDSPHACSAPAPAIRSTLPPRTAFRAPAYAASFLPTSSRDPKSRQDRQCPSLDQPRPDSKSRQDRQYLLPVKAVQHPEMRQKRQCHPPASSNSASTPRPASSAVQSVSPLSARKRLRKPQTALVPTRRSASDAAFLSSQVANIPRLHSKKRQKTENPIGDRCAAPPLPPVIYSITVSPGVLEPSTRLRARE